MDIKKWKVHELFNKHSKEVVAEVGWWEDNKITIYYCSCCEGFFISPKFNYLLKKITFFRKAKKQMSSEYKKKFNFFFEELTGVNKR